MGELCLLGSCSRTIFQSDDNDEFLDRSAGEVTLAECSACGQWRIQVADEWECYDRWEARTADPFIRALRGIL